MNLQKILLTLCSFQECTNARTVVFQKLLLDHNKLKRSHKQLQEVLKNKDAAHATALQKERDEVSRLQKEHARVQGEKTDIEKALMQREEAAQKHKETLEATEVRATSAQGELDALKAKCDTWLGELTRLNKEMDSKFPLSFLFVSLTCTDVKYMPVYNSIR